MYILTLDRANIIRIAPVYQAVLVNDKGELIYSSDHLTRAGLKKLINAHLIDEVDSATISGYPASVLMFANFVENDTIIQKQFVTYIQKTHTLLYLNENFLYKNWDKGQKLGDELMKNIVIRDVKNPIDEKFKKMDASEPKE